MRMHPDFKDNGVVPRPLTWAEKDAERAKNEVIAVHGLNLVCDSALSICADRTTVFSNLTGGISKVENEQGYGGSIQ